MKVLREEELWFSRSISKILKPAPMTVVSIGTPSERGAQASVLSRDCGWRYRICAGPLPSTAARRLPLDPTILGGIDRWCLARGDLYLGVHAGTVWPTTGIANATPLVVGHVNAVPPGWTPISP